MKRVNILIMSIVAMLLISCNEQLDLPTDGRITMDQVFSDYNRIRGYLNSCYGHCPPPHMNRSSYTDEAQNVYGSRSEEHTSELQSLMRISYAVFCLKKKTHDITTVLHKYEIFVHSLQLQYKTLILTTPNNL